MSRVRHVAVLAVACAALSGAPASAAEQPSSASSAKSGAPTSRAMPPGLERRVRSLRRDDSVRRPPRRGRRSTPTARAAIDYPIVLNSATVPRLIRCWYYSSSYVRACMFEVTDGAYYYGTLTFWEYWNGARYVTYDRVYCPAGNWGAYCRSV